MINARLEVQEHQESTAQSGLRLHIELSALASSLLNSERSDLKLCAPYHLGGTSTRIVGQCFCSINTGMFSCHKYSLRKYQDWQWYSDQKRVALCFMRLMRWCFGETLQEGRVIHLIVFLEGSKCFFPQSRLWQRCFHYFTSREYKGWPTFNGRIRKD